MNKIDNILDFANKVKNSAFELSINEEYNKPFTNNINLDHIDQDLYVLLSYNGHLQYSNMVYRPDIDITLYYNPLTEELGDTIDLNPMEISGGVNLSMKSIEQIKEIYSLINAYGRPLNNDMEFIINKSINDHETSLIFYSDKKDLKFVDFAFDYSRVEELDIAPELLLRVMNELEPLTIINLNLTKINEPSLV
jgi:hypothetical protein